MEHGNGSVTPATRAWAQTAAHRIARRAESVQTRRRRRMLLVHLDGVPMSLLRTAVEEGRMPFLSRLVRSGAYHLDGAFWGSPASTPAFQAGVLYGLRHPDLPAYSWYDRHLGRAIKMNVPRDAADVERRIERQASGSLLEDGGTAYLSLFRAGASNRLCMSGLADRRAMAAHVLANLRGVRAPRRQTTCRFLHEVAQDTWRTYGDVRRWAGHLKDWRHEKEYLLNRLFLISLAWNLAVSRTLIDMVRGVPAIYLVFGNYDEIAHRRGPLSSQATAELWRADAQLEALYAMAKHAPVPYDVYFVTDHGHVDSSPFERRAGEQLKDYLLQGAPVPLPPDVERALLDGRQALPDAPSRVTPEVVDAGNFAHVYLTRGAAPLEARELLSGHREVLSRAVGSSLIGLCALRRGDHAVAVIRGGVYRAEEIDGSPLPSVFSRRAVADLLRELPRMPTAGDLVLYGDAVPRGGTVGFAWEFGSHGGLTRIETESAVLWPADAPVDLGGLSHSTQLHQRLSELYRS